MGLGPGSEIPFPVPGYRGQRHRISDPEFGSQHCLEPFPLAARKVSFSLPFRVLLFSVSFILNPVLSLFNTFLYFVFFNWIISVEIYVCFNKTSIE